MASIVAMQEAQEDLPELMERVDRGEEIVIEREGCAAVKLVAVPPAPLSNGKRVFGQNFMGILRLEPGWEDDLPLDTFDVFREDEPAGE